MCRRVLHSIVLAVFLIQSSACATTTRTMDLSELTPESIPLSKVVILHTDEGAVELTNVEVEPPYVRGNIASMGRRGGQIYELHMDDIRAVEIEEISGARAFSNVGMVGALLMVGGLVLAISSLKVGGGPAPDLEG